MAKKIRSQDIFQGDVFAQQRKSAQEFIKTLDALQGELKQVLQINKAIIDQSAKEIKTTETLKKRAQATREVQNASKGLEQVEQQRQKTLQQIERTTQAKLRTEKQVSMEEERQIKAKKKKLALMNKENSAYTKQSKKLTELRNRYKNLAVQNKHNTKEGQRLLKTIQKLDSKLKRVDKTVGQSQRNVGNYGSAWGRLKGKLIGVAGAFGIMGGAMGAVRLIKGVFNVVADFDTAIANLGAISNASEKEMEQLTSNALKLGETTKFTATEVAGLSLELAKLGFSTPQILQSTESILALASATGTELADASFIAGSTLRAFNMDASEMERVASVLGVSTTKSALNMEWLQTAMSKVAPVANALGFSIEGTTAMLGTLANAGFDASSGATATKNILLKLADSSGELAQALGRPITNLDELVPALKELEAKGVDLSEALELTDKRSVAAFQTFINGTDTLGNLKTELTDVSDELQAMSDKQLDTINGQLALLNSKWQGMILGASESGGAVEKLKGAIRFLTENLETILSVIYNVVKALIIFKTTQFIVNSAMAIGRAVMIAYRISVVAMSRGVKSATRMMKIFNTTIKSNPIGLLISALTTAIALLWDFESAEDSATQKAEKLAAAISDVNKAFDENKKKVEDAQKDLDVFAKSKIADLKKELALLDQEGGSIEDIAKKRKEIRKVEEDALRDKWSTQTVFWTEESNKVDDLWVQKMRLEEQLVKQDDIIDKRVLRLENLDINPYDQMHHDQEKVATKLKDEIKIKEEMIAQQEKLADGEMEIMKSLEAKLNILKKTNETEDIKENLNKQRNKSVAYYKQLITDQNKLLNEQVTTRKQAIPIQAKIKKYEKEIDKILGKKGTKARTYNDILKQQVAYETELLKLQRERLALIADQDQELLEFQIKNVNEWIDAEIKLRQEQAKSKEFIEKGNKVSLTELQNLLDLRFEMEKELLEKQLLEQQTKATESNADYKKKIEKRVKDKQLTQDQADALIEASRKKLIEKLALLEQEHLHDVSEKNDSRVIDFKDTDKEIAELTDATIESMWKDAETTEKIEKDALKQRLNAYKEFTTEIIRLIDVQTDKKIKAIDKELSASKKREDELRQLAIKGTTTAEQSLAAEQKRQAELERQKAELEKKKLRRQAIVSGLELLSNKLDNDEPDAVGSTIRDITALIGILSTLPAFKEGSEYVTNGKAPKGRDKIIARIDEGERILTRDQNRSIGNMSNEELTEMARTYKEGMFDDVNYLSPKLKNLHRPYQSNSQILSKFDELKTAIEIKPMLTEIRWDEISKMIIEKVETKNTITKNHSSTKGIF